MSHCKPGSVKTDASWKDIWHIMLEWVRQRAPLKNQPKNLSAGLAIMSKTNMKGLTSNGVEEDKEAEPVEEAQAEANGQKEDVPAAEPSSNSYMGADYHVNFDEQLGRDADRGKYVRYQLAPRENWGPMSRAK